MRALFFQWMSARRFRTEMDSTAFSVVDTVMAVRHAKEHFMTDLVTCIHFQSDFITR